MIKQWNFVKLPDMYYNNEGYFVLRFHSHKERDDVLLKGPYTIRNMPMLLAEWKPNFNLKNDMMRTIPVWVQLPQLPLHLWGPKNLGKITSVLGTPLMTDECTANRYRISYARILVEIDVTQELITEITITNEKGDKMQQQVEYEWRPPYCSKCHRFGHKCEEKQQKNPTKKWIPKENKNQEDRVAATENETLKTPSQKSAVQEHPKSGAVLQMTISKHKGADKDTPWTEVRKTEKAKAKGNDTGKSPQIKMPKNNYRNFYAALEDGSASVFLEDVP
jgi:hypothetical protein